MALETDYPEPKKAPKGPQPKDTDAALPKDHDTTAGDTYGTSEGVKKSEEQFEQVLVPKKEPSNAPDKSETDDDSDNKKAAKAAKGKAKQ